MAGFIWKFPREFGSKLLKKDKQINYMSQPSMRTAILPSEHGNLPANNYLSFWAELRKICQNPKLTFKAFQGQI